MNMTIEQRHLGGYLAGKLRGAISTVLFAWSLMALGTTVDVAEPQPAPRESVLEFLRTLLTVIQHDDLADRQFLERALGVRFVKKKMNPNEWIRSPLSKPRPDQESFDIENLPAEIAQLLAGDARWATHYYTNHLSNNTSEARLFLVFLDEDSRPSCIKPSEVIAVFGSSGPSSLKLRPRATVTETYRYTKQNRIVAAFSFDLALQCMSRIFVGQNIKE